MNSFAALLQSIL